MVFLNIKYSFFDIAGSLSKLFAECDTEAKPTVSQIFFFCVHNLSCSVSLTCSKNTSVAKASLLFLEILQNHACFEKYCSHNGFRIAAHACCTIIKVINPSHSVEQIENFLRQWCEALYDGLAYGGSKNEYQTEEKVICNIIVNLTV